jgi:uncharacterized membrane protein YphA (DoxX/SURF4 family)
MPPKTEGILLVMKTKVIGYWATTLTVALELLVGGEWDLAHRPNVVQVVTHLGYPVYLLTILGFWKLLAAIALLASRFARLKEWAYAGIVFELTGAAVSQAVRGHRSDLIGPLVLLGLALASWALRPQSRVLGTLFPKGEA